MHLLFVVDHNEISTPLASALAARGVTYDTHLLSKELALSVATDDPLVVDCVKDNKQGLLTVIRVRQAGITAPIFLIAEQESPKLLLEAYDAGADAVVLRSEAPSLLTATIVAARRRLKPKVPVVIECGNVRLNTSTGTVAVDGKTVEITPCEFSVLSTLMSAQGGVVPREVLSSRLTEHSRETEGTALRVFICRVRRKLARSGADDIIHTVWGTGYRVEAPVRRRAAQSRANAPTERIIEGVPNVL